MGSQCVLRWFGDSTGTARGGLKRYRDLVIYWRRTQFASHQIYRRVMEESGHNPHPNVLPTIDVSESLSPFCIMTPWTPDGNITQYIQKNPGANRLMLVRAHLVGITGDRPHLQ